MNKLAYLSSSVVLCFSLSSSPVSAQDGTSLIRGRGLAKTVSTETLPTNAKQQLTGAVTTGKQGPESTSNHSLQGSFPDANCQHGTGASTERESNIGSSSPLITVCSSLAVVLGLFASLIWTTRKFGGRGSGRKNIPKEAFQTLGTTSIDPRTQVSLLRCGKKILIVAQTSNGVHPLGEITDKEEVSHLIATCSGDSKQQFHTALSSIETDRAGTAYLGNEANPPSGRSRGRLFASALPLQLDVCCNSLSPIDKSPQRCRLFSANYPNSLQPTLAQRRPLGCAWQVTSQPDPMPSLGKNVQLGRNTVPLQGEVILQTVLCRNNFILSSMKDKCRRSVAAHLTFV